MCIEPVQAIQANNYLLYLRFQANRQKFINNDIYICGMEWTDDFDPISKVAGNIEITFNSKNKEFDIYEDPKDQLVVTIGKSGRANRLTFEKPDSDEMKKAANALSEIADSLERLEEEQKLDLDEDFDESKVLEDEDKKEIRKNLPEDSDKPILESDLFEETDLDAETFNKKLDELKRDGEIYEPADGCVATI